MMMTGQEIIHNYTQILADSREMVAAAEENRWEDLINIELNRRRRISEVTQAGPLSDRKLRDEKEMLIRGILTADAQVKTLTEKWMIEIQAILKSLNAERKLVKAYEIG